MRGGTFPPSNLFPPASRLPSCPALGGVGGIFDRAVAVVVAIALSRALTEHGDKHRRDILQEILGFSLLEYRRGVLFQFIGNLINDETAARGQRVVGFLEQSQLLVDLENAKGNARQNEITV